MKKLSLSFIGFLIWINAFAVVNAFRGTTNSNFSVATNWTQGTTPTASDGFITTFDASSPNCTVNVASNCQSLDFTGYTNVLTFTNNLTTTSATITFISTMSSRTAGAGILIMSNTTAITTNGCTFLQPIQFSTSSTKTITGTLTCSGLLTSVTATQTVNGGALILNGGLTMTAAMTGTTTVNLNGGTLQGVGVLSNPLTLSGTNTISGTVTCNGGITATSSTTTTTGSTLNITAACTINTGSIVNWTNVTFNGAVTFTLGSALNMSGQLILTSSPTFAGAFDIACGNVLFSSSGAVITLSGNINATGTASSGASTGTTINGAFNVNVSGAGSVTIGTNWGGTATLNYTGTGTFAGATGTSILSLNTTINTTGAIFNSFSYRINTLTWTAIGTSTFGSMTLVLNLAATMTVNCAGLVIPTLTLGGSTNTTLNGSNGFTITNYNISLPGSTSKITWGSGLTYTITSSILLYTTTALLQTWVSSSPGTRYTVTLSNGATCDIAFASITDCDASNGSTMCVYKPAALSNTLNWNTLPTQPQTISTAISN